MDPYKVSIILSHFHGLAAAFITLICIISITKPCVGARPEPELMSSNRTDFVKTSCKVTMYPKICYKTLSSYASTIQTSPWELANSALSVSLNGAISTSNVVSKLSKEHELRPGEAAAIGDCIENMKDSVDELQQSLVAMKDLKDPDFETKMGNVQTWVSAALTNEDTYMDGFEEKAVDGKIKDTVKSNIARVAQLNSNALAFINRLS